MTTSRNSDLSFEITSLLRGSTSAGDAVYTCAEIAFLMSKLAGLVISNDADLIEFINRLDSSVELRADLMRDALPHWERISGMLGKYSREQCEKAVWEFAQRPDLANANVPESLIPLVTKVLSSSPGGLMADIACGRGCVLSKALADDEDLQGEGIDIDQRNANFAEMVVAPSKPRGAIYCRSAFDFLADHMWKYDKVFCFPPLGMRSDRNARWDEFQSMLPDAFPGVGIGCRSELLFTLATIAAVKETGRAVVLLPEGALVNQMAGSLAARDYLLRSGYLDCVISLPERMLERTQLGVSLLIFSRKENRKFVTMIDASSLGRKGRRFSTLPAAEADRIVNAVYGFRNDASWTLKHCKLVSCDEISQNGCNLSARHYLEKEFVPEFDDSMRFKDVLLKVERGASIASSDMDDLVAHGKGACYYLSPGYIDSGIISGDLPEMKELPARSLALEADDIILTRTGDTSKTAIFEGGFDKPVILSANLLVCRLDKAKIAPWFFKAFLESEEGRALMASISVGAVIKSISLKNLEEMRIPLPPMAKQKTIGDDFRKKFQKMKALKLECERVSRELSRVFGHKSNRKGAKGQ